MIQLHGKACFRKHIASEAADECFAACFGKTIRSVLSGAEPTAARFGYIVPTPAM